MAEAYWSGWDPSERGSRFTSEIEFVLPVSQEASIYADDARTFEEEHSAAIAWATTLAGEVNQAVPGAEAQYFESGIGRGAEAFAVGIAIVGALSAPGGIRASAQLAADVFRHLRQRGHSPSLSLGAAEMLCFADLLRRDPSLNVSEVQPLLTTETSEVGPPTELGHSGADMFTVILINSSNTRSWLYLISSYGKILHFSEGEPIPSIVAAYLRRYHGPYNWEDEDDGDFLCDG